MPHSESGDESHSQTRTNPVTTREPSEAPDREDHHDIIDASDDGDEDVSDDDAASSSDAGPPHTARPGPGRSSSNNNNNKSRSGRSGSNTSSGKPAAMVRAASLPAGTVDVDVDLDEDDLDQDTELADGSNSNSKDSRRKQQHQQQHHRQHHHAEALLTGQHQDQDQDQYHEDGGNLIGEEDDEEGQIPTDALTGLPPQASGFSHKSIGHYLLSETIGEGTFGKVKLGRQVLTGEPVAVKVLEKEKIQEAADVERVAREIHILKLIRRCPHIIQLYEIIETPRQLYLIMEFAPGGELFDYIVERGRAEEAEACRFLHQILAGLEKVHEYRVVHRDLKPENLLLTASKDIKIVDFGLSNTHKEGQLLETACGSPCYAAPEMIQNLPYHPPLVDIWSCGVTLFALVCGYLPFENDSHTVLYKKICAAEYELPGYISESVSDLIRRMLTTDPAKRITLPEIREHPWYKQIPEASLDDFEDHGILEESVLTEMADKYGFQREYVEESVLGNRHNHASTTYYLLKKRLGAPEHSERPPVEANPRDLALEACCAEGDTSDNSDNSLLDTPVVSSKEKHDINTNSGSRRRRRRRGGGRRGGNSGSGSGNSDTAASGSGEGGDVTARPEVSGLFWKTYGQQEPGSAGKQGPNNTPRTTPNRSGGAGGGSYQSHYQQGQQQQRQQQQQYQQHHTEPQQSPHHRHRHRHQQQHQQQSYQSPYQQAQYYQSPNNHGSQTQRYHHHQQGAAARNNSPGHHSQQQHYQQQHYQPQPRGGGGAPWSARQQHHHQSQQQGQYPSGGGRYNNYDSYNGGSGGGKSYSNNNSNGYYTSRNGRSAAPRSADFEQHHQSQRSSLPRAEVICRASETYTNQLLCMALNKHKMNYKSMSPSVMRCQAGDLRIQVETFRAGSGGDCGFHVDIVSGDSRSFKSLVEKLTGTLGQWCDVHSDWV